LPARRARSGVPTWLRAGRRLPALRGALLQGGPVQARDLHRIRGRRGVLVRRAVVFTAALAVLAHGCDSGSAPPGPEGPGAAERARQEARGAMTAVVKAAAATT